METNLSKEIIWKINTSNPNKLKEFQQIFSRYGVVLESTSLDLPEIDADPIDVVVHKASQLGDKVIVDDSLLDVEGIEIGIHVKWLMDHLSKFVGHKAVWTVLLAYKEKGEVFVFEGKVHGTIVSPRGSGNFGFNPIFQPEDSTKTLAEEKPDRVNARAIAVEALMNGRIKVRKKEIANWKGPWQKS